MRCLRAPEHLRPQHLNTIRACFPAHQPPRAVRRHCWKIPGPEIGSKRVVPPSFKRRWCTFGRGLQAKREALARRQGRGRHGDPGTAPLCQFTAVQGGGVSIGIIVKAITSSLDWKRRSSSRTQSHRPPLAAGRAPCTGLPRGCAPRAGSRSEASPRGCFPPGATRPWGRRARALLRRRPRSRRPAARRAPSAAP